MVIENSIREYQNSRAIIKSIEDKIKSKENQIEKLKKRKSRIQDNNWWGDVLIRPIMADIKLKYPDLTWDDERLVPMGLRCEVSVFGHDKDNKTVASITFTPGANGYVYYDTGEKHNTFAPGTIGYINQMNCKSELIDSMETLYRHIERQAYENELTHLR